MKHSHTPGPWKANLIGLQIFIIPEDRSKGEVVGICKLGSDSTGAYLMPYEANAQLIATSPELLERLIQASIALKALGASTEMVELIEATLTKARGES